MDGIYIETSLWRGLFDPEGVVLFLGLYFAIYIRILWILLAKYNLHLINLS